MRQMKNHKQESASLFITNLNFDLNKYWSKSDFRHIFTRTQHILTMFRKRHIITPITTICAVFLAVVQYNSLRRRTRLTTYSCPLSWPIFLEPHIGKLIKDHFLSCRILIVVYSPFCYRLNSLVLLFNNVVDLVL